MDKEKIYDEQIAPLVDKIVEICKRHEIDFAVNFHIPAPTDANGEYCGLARVIMRQNYVEEEQRP